MAIFFQNLGQHGIPMHSGHNHCMLQTKTSLVPSLCLVHRCACLNSQYSPVTRCKNFDRGKISPLFLTTKFSLRNSPLPKFPPPPCRACSGSYATQSHRNPQSGIMATGESQRRHEERRSWSPVGTKGTGELFRCKLTRAKGAAQNF